MKIKIVGAGKIGRVFKERFNDEIVEQVNYSLELNNAIKCDVVIDFSHPDNHTGIQNTEFIKCFGIQADIYFYQFRV